MVRRILALVAASAAMSISSAPGQKQDAAPSPPQASATASPAATATPSPPGSTARVIDQMSPADLQQAVQLLKNNYINPEALNEAELNRAMLTGILSRLGRGAILLEQPPSESSDPAHQFFAEVIDGHVAYIRPGPLTQANLEALDAALEKFAAEKVDAAVLDLRASGATNDFALAAEFAKRFAPRGKPLFTLRKGAGRQERAFVSDRDPRLGVLTIVLVDGETAGPAEAVAGALRVQNKALIIGQPTAGRAVEYSDLPLNGGRMLRVAVAEAVLPEGNPLFPGGLQPDLPVELAAATKRQIFEESRSKGMAPFVHEPEVPHMNEAALLAGRSPELEAIEAAQRRERAGEKPLPRDPVVQRAMDVLTSVAIYQRR